MKVRKIHPAPIVGIIVVVVIVSGLALGVIKTTSTVTFTTMPSTTTTSIQTTSTTNTTSTANSPIKHIVFLIQENHTTCNMFCTYPGIPSGYGFTSYCMPQPTGPCQKLFNADNNQSIQNSIDICHTSNCAHNAYDSGLMDGFGTAQSSAKANLPMAYYDNYSIPYYWDWVQYYTLNYNFFSSAMSFSLPNHLYTVAAKGGITDACTGLCTTPYNLTFADIGTEMTQNGMSWAYYQYNWNNALNCDGVVPWDAQHVNSAESGRGGFDGFWSGEAEFSIVQQTASECHNLKNYNNLLTDISQNNLPQVSWIIPAPSVSEHPQQSTWLQGEQYTASIINKIEASSAWSSTVIYLTWDDYGGYYDPVVPTQIDNRGMGFRVPMIAISPYSIHGGMVSGPSYNYPGGSTNQEDFSSMLSTIEHNWNIPPLTQRDSEQPSLFYMLNFNQQPLPPLFISSVNNNIVYPYTSCIARGGCSISSPLVSYYQIPGSSFNEPVNLALQMSGDGDPGD